MNTMQAVAPRATASGVPLRFNAIDHVYETAKGPLAAVAGVSLDVAAGEFVSIIGPTGCGKSTLLRIAGGLIAPTSGTVDIAGEAPVDASRRKRLGYVFQDPALLPWRSVRANVSLPSEVNTGTHNGADIDALLSMVGLAEHAGRHPHELSGGMRQRVALARALAIEPSVLLMDEPFAALDEITREAMRYELLSIWEQRRVTVLFVTHSIREAIVLSDRVVVLSERPGSVRADIPIDFPRPRRYEIERSPAFLDTVDELRRLLQ